MRNDSKINALISLLDDPDKQVYNLVREELMFIGQEVVPILEDAWDVSYDAFFQDRVENIIHEIHFDHLKEEFTAWGNDSDRSLLYGAYLISKYQYPDLNFEEIDNYVYRLWQDIWIEMNPKFTALEKVQLINQIFFKIHGFKGNRKNFYSPQNSYIHQVIEVKKGNPISLSLLYIELARRLKVPIYGVNLPQHFIMAHTSVPIEYLDKPKKKDVLFYINTFNNGSLFKEKDIHSFLKQLGVKAEERFFIPCDSVTIIERTLKNLAFSYTKAGEAHKVKELNELLSCINAEEIIEGF